MYSYLLKEQTSQLQAQGSGIYHKNKEKVNYQTLQNAQNI